MEIDWNGVAFVSNSTLSKGGIWEKAFPTWKGFGDNFVINGKDNVYGEKAFVKMLDEIDKDYVIYIDEDCFIVDEEALYEEFLDFKNSGTVVRGMPDGGVVCHRNYNQIAINPFLSFWNLGIIRKLGKFKNNYVPLRGNILYDMSSLVESLVFAKKKRKYIPEFAIKNTDGTFIRTSFQKPYSHNHSMTYERYYGLWSYLTQMTKTKLSYTLNVDSCFIDDLDKTGTTTATFSHSGKLISYHLWYTRFYRPDLVYNKKDTIFPNESPEMKRYHTERINSFLAAFESNGLPSQVLP